MYIASQQRNGDLEEFFKHENQPYRPSLSEFGNLRFGKKSDLISCVNKQTPPPLPPASYDVNVFEDRIKWDWLKFKIKMSSIAFSKKMSRECRKLEEELNSKYEDALNRFQQNPSNVTKQEAEKLKSELEAFYDQKVEGIIVRSRARWHEHGERNSKYFLNLEKGNHIKKHIRKLYISGTISTDPFQIMDAHKSFYSKVYQRQQTNQKSAEAKRFLDNPSIAKLSEEQRTSCEGKIAIEECEKILGSFQTGKTPGNDGIPIEFYKTFWPLIGDFMVNSFNEAYDNKEMSSSQRQAIITLIEKKGKDRNYLENWRPISLTNVDAKIALKVIAAGIIPALPEIITSTQTGYVQGRFIGEAVRSIIDVMDYTKEQNIPGILLFIDFEKAFDSLDWNFMLKCLNVFGFGPSLIRWIETFYTNISSCVLNNGLCFQYFEVQRGVRQGDPLSPLLIHYCC